jgi:hypothetical protein
MIITIVGSILIILLFKFILVYYINYFITYLSIFPQRGNLTTPSRPSVMGRRKIAGPKRACLSPKEKRQQSQP